MKKINKSIIGLCIASLTLPVLTGCIDETEPRNGVATNDQAQGSASATQAMVNGLPAYAKTPWGDEHWAYGTPALMRIRDVMADDYVVVDHDYNQFGGWILTRSLGPSYLLTQFVNSYYYNAILAANMAIEAVNPEKASKEQLGYLGIGYAYRATTYLDAARMYEFLPNDIFPDGKNDDGNDVKGLTCPIVTEKTTEAESRNNPRVSHEVMAKFIEDDLNKAEEYIVNSPSNGGNTLPNLAVVYGLKARLYMWNEDYAKAKEYARKAIDTYGGAPMTEEEATDTKKGFNDISKWMWGIQYTKEDRAVKTGIVNFTSFASNETSFGYAANGPMNMIGKRFYDRMSNTDWRKKMWKAPAGTSLESENKYVDATFKDKIPELGSLKFRPNQGNFAESSVATVSAVPLMRVEEMYFIEAEAAEHLATGTGLELLKKFMTAYRDPEYTYVGADNLDEIIFQKRIELWGEGLTFYDIKRLNISVTRGYVGTNFFDLFRYNTKGRPAWMNFCLVNLEENNNPAIAHWNNPDPSMKYQIWTKK